MPYSNKNSDKDYEENSILFDFLREFLELRKKHFIKKKKSPSTYNVYDARGEVSELEKKFKQKNNLKKDIIDLISEEFYYFEELEEKIMAWNYCIFLYYKFTDESKDLFEIACRKEPNSQERHMFIMSASKHINKAFEAIYLCKNLIENPKEIMNSKLDYSSCLTILFNFKNQINLSLEFPFNFRKIYQLEQQLAECIKNEKYEVAVAVRDKIQELMYDDKKRLGVLDADSSLVSILNSSTETSEL